MGRPRAIRVPRDRATEPIRVQKAAVLAGYSGWGEDPGDLLVVPDESSRRQPPWVDSPSIVMADLIEHDGSVSPLCSRSALKRILARAGERDIAISAASEFEFFLISPETRRPIYNEIENYSITKGAEIEPVLRRVRNELRDMDIPVEASNPEYSGGQVEVNLTHGPALDAADRATLLRSFVRKIARQEGLDATFMAKPWTDQAGSGMHVHQSLWRGGMNLFFRRDGSLSEEGRHYVAGLLEYMAEFALFGCPTPNAYHRRTDLSFAPTMVCWGSDNRTLAVRSICDSEASTRIEQRDASADCNVYLTFAGQFAAGIEGMAEGAEPPPATFGNAYGRDDLQVIPTTFLDAFELMVHGRAGSLIGQGIVNGYVDVLQAEREVVLTSSSDWERDRYLSSV